MKGIPDMGGLYSMPDRLAWEAGQIGDELHGEPDFDDDGLPIMFEENGYRYWCDAKGNVVFDERSAVDFLRNTYGWNHEGAKEIVDAAVADGVALTETALKILSEDYIDR